MMRQGSLCFISRPLSWVYEAVGVVSWGMIIYGRMFWSSAFGTIGQMLAHRDNHNDRLRTLDYEFVSKTRPNLLRYRHAPMKLSPGMRRFVLIKIMVLKQRNAAGAVTVMSAIANDYGTLWHLNSICFLYQQIKSLLLPCLDRSFQHPGQ